MSSTLHDIIEEVCKVFREDLKLVGEKTAEHLYNLLEQHDIDVKNATDEIEGLKTYRYSPDYLLIGEVVASRLADEARFSFFHARIKEQIARKKKENEEID